MRVSGIYFGKANRLPLHGDFLDLPAVCRQFLLILQKGMVNWNARNLLNPSYKLSRKANESGEKVVLSDYKKGINISLGVSCTF